METIESVGTLGAPGNATRSRRHALVAALAVAGLILGLGFVVDHYTRHGVTARWYLYRQGRLERVVTTVEHRTYFPNRLRAAARMVEYWDFERWPEIPAAFPPLNARFKGFIDVPDGPYRWIELVSPNATFLNIDGVSANRVAPGRHSFEIGWGGSMFPEASLEMRWGTESGVLERIPDVAFSPQKSWREARVGGWVVTGVLMLFFGLVVFRIFRARSFAQRVARMSFVAVVSIVSLGVGLRLFDYTILPEFSLNHDGLFAMWNGWSILEDGTSRGWTAWAPFYRDQPGAELEKIFFFERSELAIVSPYMEHPPLYHILVGAFLHVMQVRGWIQSPRRLGRLVSIALQGLAILLVFLIGRRISPRGPPAYLAALLYSVIPNIAIQGRSIKEEALVTPLALAAIWLYLRARDHNYRRRDIVLAAFCAGLCPLCKVPGIAFVGALVLLLLADRQYREAGWAAVVGLGTASLIFVWAAVVNWDLFWAVQRLQATTRGSNWNVLFKLLTFAKIDHNAIGIGWTLLLWFGWALGTFRKSRRVALPLVVPALAYMSIIGVASGTWTFGWYMLPIYPFLCLGLSLWLCDFVRRPSLQYAFFFIVFGLMYTLNFSSPVALVVVYQETDPGFRAVLLTFLAMAFGPFVWMHLFPSRMATKVARAASVFGIVVFLFLCSTFIFTFEQTYSDFQHFDNEARAYRVSHIWNGLER